MIGKMGGGHRYAPAGGHITHELGHLPFKMELSSWWFQPFSTLGQSFSIVYKHIDLCLFIFTLQSACRRYDFLMNLYHLRIERVGCTLYHRLFPPAATRFWIFSTISSWHHPLSFTVVYLPILKESQRKSLRFNSVSESILFIYRQKKIWRTCAFYRLSWLLSANPPGRIISILSFISP